MMLKHGLDMTVRMLIIQDDSDNRIGELLIPKGMKDYEFMETAINSLKPLYGDELQYSYIVIRKNA